MYDYFLGGYDNHEVDREAAERVVEVHPETSWTTTRKPPPP
jgi:hypothetical protein